MVKDKEKSNDSRFALVGTDPRFKSVSKRTRKVKIDARFQPMLTDPHFSRKGRVDRQGRVTASSSRDELRKLYAMSDSEEEGEQEAAGDKESGATDSSEDDIVPGIGEGSESDDSGGSSDESISSDREEIIHDWAEFDTSVEHTEDLTCRLAVCNVDWDRVAAKDLLVLLQSFKPRGGTVKSVVIYPSEFGLERLAKEDVLGPIDLLKNKSDDLDEHQHGHSLSARSAHDDDNEEEDEEEGEDSLEEDDNAVDTNDSDASADFTGGDDDEEDEDEDDSDFDDDDDDASGAARHDALADGPEEDDAEAMEKIRQYQLNRLKYYYAVVECDSKETASAIYEQCDGMEVELSQTKLDLRFIPDSMTFDQDIKDKADDGDTAGYQPLSFFSSALQQSKVTLTWDETDKSRLHTTMRKFTANDIRDMDFKAYIASDSDDDADVEDVAIQEIAKPGKKAKTVAGVCSHGEASNSESGESKDSASRHSRATHSNKSSSYNKYRALMEEINAKERADDDAQEMQVTFGGAFDGQNADVDSSSDDGGGSGNRSKKGTARKPVADADSQLTAWERYQKEKRQKQRQRKKLAGKGQDASEEGDVTAEDFNFDDPFFAEGGDVSGSKKSKKSKKKKKMTEEEEKEAAELTLLMVSDDEGDGVQKKKHFSLKAIQEREKMEEKRKSGKKQRRKRRHEDDELATEQPSFEMDNDPRFDALYSQHNFAVDPSNPNYKETKAMQAVVAERRRRRKNEVAGNEAKERERQNSRSKDATDHHLSALVKSVRAKAGSFKRPKSSS